MKWLLETVAVAFAMFSAIPMPRIDWKRENMRCALGAFPLVGAVIGLAWWGWALLAERLALPAVLRGAVLCVLPALLTGGIHLDGYADVSDALASHASPARRREILRDAHIGAFAAIRLCVYFAVYFGLCCAVEPTATALWCAGIGFTLSRALSAAALTVFPLAEGSSLARTFADAADKSLVRGVVGAEVLLCAAALCGVGGYAGCAVVCAAAIVFARYAHTAKTQFGGISGDLAGWFLQKAELWMLLALVAVQAMEARI